MNLNALLVEDKWTTPACTCAMTKGRLHKSNQSPSMCTGTMFCLDGVDGYPPDGCPKIVLVVESGLFATNKADGYFRRVRHIC